MKSMASLKQISINDICGIFVGHATDEQNATGCTVILAPEGAMGSVDVRGGGPATRETDLLDPVRAIESVNAVVLSGGSAFGLDADSGVVAWLEEHGYGYETGWGKVPIVCGASLFDLVVGSANVRPDKQMGYAACENALLRQDADKSGSLGCGTGATVGKLLGPERLMRSGVGCVAVQLGELQLAAVIGVNALGNIYDHATGQPLAGLLSEDKNSIIDSGEMMLQMAGEALSRTISLNTTIGCIITNAKLTKGETNRVATVSHDGLARSIFPLHTQADGDAMFCLATGEVAAPLDLVASIAAEVASRAVEQAVLQASPGFGLKVAADLRK